MTKAKVISLLKKQGASYEWETPSVFSAWLPDNKIWDTGYGVGLVTQELNFDETWDDFWRSLYQVIDGEVVEGN
jgi:hypothetical protein